MGSFTLSRFTVTHNLGFLLLLLTPSMETQVDANMECSTVISGNLNCTCREVEGLFDFDCGSFVARAQPGKYLALRCLDAYSFPESPVLASNMGVLRLAECSAPPSHSYCEYLYSETDDCALLSTLSFRSIKSGQVITKHFSNFFNLKNLDLKENNLTSLPDDLLFNMTSLIRLDLTNNSLTSLPAGFFEYSSNMKYLYLDHNELLELEDDLFANLSSLQYLSLHCNHLSYVSSMTFAGLVNLEHLDLSCNFLQRLPFRAFKQLRSLVHVDLSENFLLKLPFYLFDDMQNLTEVRIHKNGKTMQISNDTEWIEGHDKTLEIPNFILSNLHNLKRVTISSSGLSVIPRFFVKNSVNLLEIDLHDNSLPMIPRFILDDCEKLQILDLSQNSISELPTDILTPLKDLRELYLAHNVFTGLPYSYTAYSRLQVLQLHNNSLSTLPKYILRQLRKSTALRSVTLAGNPWNCDCRLRDLLDFIRNKPSLVSDLDYLTCDTGEIIKNLRDDYLCSIVDV